MSIPGTLLPLSASLALVLATACADDPVKGARNDPASSGELETAPGDPLPGLTEEQLAAFEVGVEEFSEIEEVEEGLGPVFNEAGCAVCHASPAVGGASDVVEFRFGFTDADGNFDPLGQLGGSLQNFTGIGEVVGVPGCEGFVFEAEQIPAEANTVAGRATQPVFGLGLIDNVPDQTFHDLAAYQAEVYPETAGRVSLVTNVGTGEEDVGRFGWKAQVASVFDFSGDAYLNEMGITNPLFPDDSCPQGNCDALACDPVAELEDDGTALTGFTDFMTFLAPTPTLPIEGDAVTGQELFASIGCASCHTPELTTGPSDVEPLNNVTFAPYSDFLLHDMGALGDGIVQGGTGAREMRTTPLWGLRFRTLYLHDGRTTSISEAILAHAGQGQAAADQFAALDDASKNAVLQFLSTL
jgi:CxxC motif-containing protein (DUF1111 family)